MTNRDDMVISPKLKRRSEHSVRDKAVEERKTKRAKKRTNRMNARARRIAAARRLASRSTRGRVGGKGLGSKIGKAGWMFILSELLLAGGEGVRRVGSKNMSQRLVAAQDRDDMFLGNVDEKARAKAAMRNFIESDEDLLFIIGSEGGDKVNDHIFSIAEDIGDLALAKAMREDMIDRDPRFDSRDTLQDQMIHILKDEAAMAHLKEKANEAIEVMKEFLGRRDGR